MDEKDAVGNYLSLKYGLSRYATNASSPNTPTNFTASGMAPYQLNLRWASTSSNIYSFHVERKLGTNGAYQEIGAVSSYLDNFIDTTACPTNQYYYQVKAHGLFGDSAYSTVISPPTVGLTSWPPTILENTTNLIVAQAADVNGIVNNVKFFNNNTFIGTATSVPYSASWIPTLEGSQFVAALATDSLGNSQYSAAVTVTVYLDANGDGIPDVWEVQSGNDPLNPWIPPASNTNDNIAPIITLMIPTNAIIVP